MSYFGTFVVHRATYSNEWAALCCHVTNAPKNLMHHEGVNMVFCMAVFILANSSFPSINSPAILLIQGAWESFDCKGHHLVI